MDAALFGAVTSKPVEAAEAELAPELKGKGLTYRSPIVRMRQLFDLYVCLRPCKAYPGNPLNHKEGIDLVVFRENTEDLYAGVEFGPVPQELVATLRQAVAALRPLRGAAGRPVRGVLQDQHAQGLASGSCAPPSSSRERTAAGRSRSSTRRTWSARPTACSSRKRKKVAQDFPEIQVDDANIDAICMWLLKNPLAYDVLVAPNLYGDIISDLCAQMVGGLGFGCSGNIGEKLAVFEPTHGSAPKYAGQYKVNPIATILAAKMMLDWLGEREKAERIELAVSEVIKDGRVRTYDMGGTGSTREMGKAIAAAVGETKPVGVGQQVSAPDIFVHEVGLRDGLQMEERVVPTEQKIAWAEALLGSWVDMLQLGSFVHPAKVPQMADTDRLFEHFAAAQAGERRALRPGAQPEGPRARARLRRRHVLHGRLGERDPQPPEHRHEHRGGERADHRGRDARPSRPASACRCRCSRPSAAATRARCRRSASSRSSGRSSTRACAT